MASRLGLGPQWSSAGARLLTSPGRRPAVELAKPGLTRSKHRGPAKQAFKTTPTPSLSSQTARQVVLVHPHTYVAEPLGKHILRPLTLLSILKTKVIRYATDYAALVALSISSKPSWLKAAKFKMNNSKILPVAKAMHREYYEALAQGNTPALARLATQSHSSTMAGILSRRQRGRRFEWELVRYTKPLSYPRIVDQKVWSLTPMSPTTRQTIVAISSIQRLVEYDDANGGAVVSEKLTEKVENMMMVSEISQRTFKQSDWKIHGFLEPMTVELYEDTKRLNDQALMEG